MAVDKKTIGITKANASALLEIMRSGYFISELDAAKFAMAYAIKKGIPAGTTEGAETKWNVGSVDPDGSVRALLEALYPLCSEPYRLMEHLMNEGIISLSAEHGDRPDVYEALFGNQVD
jgi:hypothetical protein